MLTAESFMGVQERTLNHFRKMEKEKRASTPSSPWRSMQDGGMGVLPEPHPAPSPRSTLSVLTGRAACPPLFLGKVQRRGTDDTRKVDFITSNENTADSEVLRKVYDGFLTPLPTPTLSRVLYMNQVTYVC